MAFPTQPVSFDTLGGLKEDFTAVEDPTTDRSADEVNLAFDTVAMLSQTTMQARVQFLAGANPTIVSHRALWGSSVAIVPLVSHSMTGQYVVTWPASVDTGLDNVPVNLSVGKGYFSSGSISPSATPCGFVNVDRVTANVFKVYTFNSSGVAHSMTGSKLNVEVY